MDEWIKKIWYIHTHTHTYIDRQTETHTHNGKKRNLAICNNMDVPWGYYIKWNKPNTERKLPMISLLFGI